MASKTKGAAPKSNPANTLNVIDQQGKSKERKMAELALSPVVANIFIATKFAKNTFSEIGLSEAVDVMKEMRGSTEYSRRR